MTTTLASELATRLDVLAARAVDLACSGNIKAIGLIAERIEGRVGMRPGEVAPEREARREGLQAVIESIVTAMANAKIASTDDSSEGSASDRMPVVIDAEVPALTRRRAPEIGRTVQAEAGVGEADRIGGDGGGIGPPGRLVFAAGVDQGGLDTLVGQPLHQCPPDELWAVVSGLVRTRCHPQ